jgi:inner membrane protein
MDNLTHSLVGLAASKAGLERLSPATSAVCIIASNAPDADILTLLFGDRWFYLHHHRGITHSIIGTFLISLAIPLIFFAFDRLIAYFKKTKPKLKLAGLTIASLIVGASHPLMDWTNNYGVRPLLPWNSKWFYGDLVFIVDPFIWVTLGGAAFLLTSNTKLRNFYWLVLAAALTFVVMFASRPGVTNLGTVRIVWIMAVVLLVILQRLDLAKRWGSKIAVSAFVILVAYWGGLFALHRLALAQTTRQATTIAQGYGETVVDLAAMPTLANPFHWQSVVETERAAYRFEVYLLGESSQELVRHERPDSASSPMVGRVLGDRRARIFLDFARFPVARVKDPDCTTQTIVQLADLRYTEPGNQRGTFALQLPVECSEPLRSNR